MKEKAEKGVRLVRCISCRHFSYFENKCGHNSPLSLGFCKVESWDGNKSQWPMFLHPCKNVSFLTSSK